MDYFARKKIIQPHYVFPLGAITQHSQHMLLERKEEKGETQKKHELNIDHKKWRHTRVPLKGVCWI